MQALIDSSKFVTWCASRRCRGSVAEVAPFLAERFADDATVVTGSGRLTVVLGAPRGIATVGPVRTYRARLAFGTWRLPTRVTIEVEPWSSTDSELLVRPTGRPPHGEEAYFASVLAALESLGAEIEANLTAASEIPSEERLRRAS